MCVSIKSSKQTNKTPKHVTYEGGPGRTRYLEGKAMVRARVG